MYWILGGLVCDSILLGAFPDWIEYGFLILMNDNNILLVCLDKGESPSNFCSCFCFYICIVPFSFETPNFCLIMWNTTKKEGNRTKPCDDVVGSVLLVPM